MATNKQTVLSAAIEQHLTHVMPDVIAILIHDFIRPNPQQAHHDKMSDVLEMLAHVYQHAVDTDDEEPLCEEDEELRTVHGDKHIFNVGTVSACMLIYMYQPY
jgi:hypothetical protein